MTCSPTTASTAASAGMNVPVLLGPAGRDRRRDRDRTATSGSRRSSSGCRRRSTARPSPGSARSATRSTTSVDPAPERGRPGDRRRPRRRGRGRQARPRRAGDVGAELTVVVNTGDDVERHGLDVWPDHDTVMYTLAGLDDREQGWGIRGETYAVAEQLAVYGEETWFRLGDRDLAAHIVRTARLRLGDRPTEVALDLQRSLGVAARILPMTDEPGPDRGPDRRRLARVPGVLRPSPPGARRSTTSGSRDRGGARPTAEVEAALAGDGAGRPHRAVEPDRVARADPGGARACARRSPAARRRGVPIVAVSGIVGGRALKGPADRMLVSLGHEASALGVARMLAELRRRVRRSTRSMPTLAPAIEATRTATLVTDTVMTDDAARARLAARDARVRRATRIGRRGRRARRFQRLGCRA